MTRFDVRASAALIVVGCVASIASGHERIQSVDGLLERTDLAVIAIPTAQQATLDRDTGGADLYDVLTVVSPIMARGAAPAEGEAILTWRGTIQGDHLTTTGHVPHLEDGQPYLLLLSHGSRGDGTWRIAAGDQGAFRIVADEAGSALYPMRFESRGILGLDDEGLLELTPTLGGISDGLAWATGSLEASMAPTPVISGPEAVSVRSRTFWQSGEILDVSSFIRLLTESTSPMHPSTSQQTLEDHLATIPSAGVTERGGLVDLCICDRWSLFLIFQVLPEDYWAYWMDQSAMWFFNQFMDIYRYIDSDGTWDSGNGVNEFAGWIDSGTLEDATGDPWDGALGLTVNRKPTGCDCCWLIESDVFYNPAFNWRSNIDNTFEMYDSHDRALYAPVQMHELGHTFGYMSDGIGSTTCQETYNYDRHSIMHAYYDDIVETGEGIHRSDAVLLRNAYEDQTGLIAGVDVGCESYYVTSSGRLSSSYMYPQCPDAGEEVTLYSIVMENMTYGWGLEDVELRVYLSKGNHNITTSDRHVATLTWSDLSSETWWEGDVTFTWPIDLDNDTYWIGLMMYLPDDVNPDEWHTDNNTTWMSMQCPGNPATSGVVCVGPLTWPIEPWQVQVGPIWIPWSSGVQDSDPPLDLPCGGGTFYGPDTWFELLSPPIDLDWPLGWVDVLVQGGAGDNVVALYEADGACAGDQPVAVVCHTGGGGDGGGPALGGDNEPISMRVPIDGNKDYLLRVGSLSGESMGGTLQVAYGFQGIPGDEPFLAAPLSGQVLGELSDNTAAGPLDPCASNHVVSEWHAWVSPATGQARATTCHASTSAPVVLSVYLDQPGGQLEHIACSGTAPDGDCGFEHGASVAWDAQAGGKYLIRVGAYDNAGTYMLTAGINADRPSHDACDAMAPLTEGLQSFSSLGADMDAVSGCGDDTETAGVWFKYAPTEEGYVTFSTCPDNGGAADYNVRLFAMDRDDCERAVRCSEPCGGDPTTLSMWVTVDSHPLLVGGAGAFGQADRGSGVLSVDLDRRCLGDTDGSGDVGIDDLLYLIGSWSGNDPMADFNNDGLVDISDLLKMLERFGCTS